jgi:type I restriction enzyme S subunit
MSDDFEDFDMEVVETDELDELAGGGAPSSEEDRPLPEKGSTEVGRSDRNPSERSRGADPETETASTDREGKAFERSGEVEGWSQKTLGSIFDQIYSGGTPKKGVDEYYGGDLPFVKIEDLNRKQGKGISTAETHITEKAVEETSTRAFDPGTLLLTIYGSLAETALVRDRVATNQAILGLWGAEEENTLYVKYAIDFDQAKLQSLSRQTTQANLGKGIVSKHRLSVPPLPEQRKIASVLYTVDQAIQKTEAIIEQTEKIRNGIINGLFEIDGVEKVTNPEYEEPRFQRILSRRKKVWKEAEKERWSRAGKERSVDPTKYTPPLGLGKKRLPELPDEWEWVPLDLFVGYDIDYRGKTPPYSEAGIPVISSGNLQNGEVVFDKPKYVSQSTYDGWLNRGVPREGDLIVTTEAPVGKVALYPEGKYLPTRRIIVLRTVGIDNRYLKAAMNHPTVQSYLAAQSRGTTVPRILKDYLLRTPIPLPPPREHNRITQVLKQLDAKLEREEGAQSVLKRLKKGLMQDLLTGEVRTVDKAIEVLEEVGAHG